MLHPHGLLRKLVPLVAVCALASPVPAQNAAQGDMVTLRFPNADVRDVLSQYEILVGKRLIYDNQVQGQVNINVPEVTKEEAIRIIEITLMMNGYHLVPVDSDPNLLKVTGLARSPRQVAVPVYSEPEPIPDNEQVVMYLVKLTYADPTELAQILQQAMPPSRPEYAPNIVALPKSQLLVLTENTAVIRAMMRLIRAADLEPTRVEGEFITLVRASAKDVVQMLEKLFEKPQQTGAVPRPAAVPKPQPEGGAPGAAAPQPVPGLTTVEIGGMTEDSMLAGKVRLTADERTNRIYVVTRPVNIPVIRKLITEFDQDVPFNEPFVRELKYVSAGDILEALVRAVSDPGAKETGSTGATSPTGRTTPTSTPAQQTNPFGSNNSLSGRGGLGSASSTQSLSLQSEPHEVVPQTVVVGNSRIMADKRRNSIIIIGSADIKEKVNHLIDRLDVRTPQVMLTTIIGELSLGDGQQLGLTYLLGKHGNLSNLVSVTGGSNTAAGSPVTIKDNAINIDLQRTLSNMSISRVIGGGVGGIQGFVAKNDNLGALVTALESSNKFRVTSRPTLFASNNKKASLISGERIAVITGVQSGLGGSASNLVQQNQVQYIDVNLSLEVVPLINSDREVHLDIVQNIAERTGESVIDNNKYPIISNRQLQTAVTVPNEGTLVLGGLIKQSQNKSTSGVPFLSRAPLIGPLFRSTSTDNKRTELVILIRPSVSMGNADAVEVRDRNMRPLEIPVNLEDGLGFKNRRADVREATSGFRANPAGVAPPNMGEMTPPPTPPPMVIPVVSEPNPKSSAAPSGARPSNAQKAKSIPQ